MSPDINLKGYYLQFIHNAKIDIRKYEDNLNTVQKVKEEIYNYLLENKDSIKESFGIKLDNYEKEFINKEYNSSERLYNSVIKLLHSELNHPKRIYLLQITKYCNLLRNEHKFNELIKLANKRKDMKFSIYRKYVSNYYSKVHECVLKGMGYKFGGGIGTYIINHWKRDPDCNKAKKILDYAATNIKKKELLSKGIKLYDDKEAAWYKARNIPYDGVDYRIYREDNDWYEFTFVKSDISRAYPLDYQRTEYVAAKYRGMSYTQMAEQLCKNEEDIYNLQVDIKYKLNILLYKNPAKYINFVRNAEQRKYKRRAYNSQN